MLLQLRKSILQLIFTTYTIIDARRENELRCTSNIPTVKFACWTSRSSCRIQKESLVNKQDINNMECLERKTQLEIKDQFVILLKKPRVT